MPTNSNLALGWFDVFAYFSIILVWAFIGLIAAQQILLQLTVNPILWLVTALSIILSFPVPITLLSWKLKDNLSHVDPQWNFAIRNVSIGEYEQMMDEYISAYPLLVSRVHAFRFIFSILIATVCLIVPYSMSQQSLDVLFLSPTVFGAIIILLGISLTASILPAMPGPLSDEFPVHDIDPFRKALALLSQVPGLYWLGLNMTIGEWEGYYSLRDPIVSARVEGIESVLVIRFEIDNKGRLLQMEFNNESDHQKFPLAEPISNPSLDIIKGSIRTILRWYMEVSEDPDFLQEVLDDLGN
ncbi:MAG: hypothetical protein P1Q69_08655 [Candidatus Thorarchaeota archaeon]|nr:hypothetical protein [Candidatus Thorarchaeota archaeon]